MELGKTKIGYIIFTAYIGEWTLSIITSQHHFKFTAALNERISGFTHKLCVKIQNIPLQRMHEKEFFILTNKCARKLKHENEASGCGLGALFQCYGRFPHLLVKRKNGFACMC